MHHSARARGFTLIEVIIAMAIVAILVGRGVADVSRPHAQVAPRRGPGLPHGGGVAPAAVPARHPRLCARPGDGRHRGAGECRCRLRPRRGGRRRPAADLSPHGDAQGDAPIRSTSAAERSPSTRPAPRPPRSAPAGEPCALRLESPSSSRANARGFTMVELLTVMSILVIILGVMAPSFSEFLAAQQAKGLSYDLTGDLMLARNEALKRNASVTVSRGGAGWAQGWSVVSVSDGESLSTRNPAAQSVTVTGAPATITFDFNGRVSSPAATVRITISSQSSSRCVQLDPSGRARARPRGVRMSAARRAARGAAAAAQRGALLIEVLVAILICAFGLLGFAGMQARATSSEFEGFQRSQALVLIEDMVSRMNANRAHAAEYVTAGLIGDGPLEDCAGLAGARARPVRVGQPDPRQRRDGAAARASARCCRRAAASRARRRAATAIPSRSPGRASCRPPARPALAARATRSSRRNGAPRGVVDRVHRAPARRSLRAGPAALLTVTDMRTDAPRHSGPAPPARRHARSS